MTSRLAARPLASRVAFGFGTGIGIGVGLGMLAWLADELGYPWSALIPANAIGAWVGVGFVLGASARTVPTGALRGVIGLLSAVVAYYLLTAVSAGGIRAIGATHAATIWGTVALAVGPVFGAAGAAWRHWSGWRRVLAVGTLSAALIAEGVAFGAFRFDDAGGWLLTLEVIVGAVLPAVLLPRRERLRGYVVTMALGVAGGLAIAPLTRIVRQVADRF